MFLGNRKGERWKRIISGIYLAFVSISSKRTRAFQRFLKLVLYITPKNQPRTKQEKLWKPFSLARIPPKKSQISRAFGSEWYPATTESKKTTKNMYYINWFINFHTYHKTWNGKEKGKRKMMGFDKNLLLPKQLT